MMQFGIAHNMIFHEAKVGYEIGLKARRPPLFLNILTQFNCYFSIHPQGIRAIKITFAG